jgi:hypothetical protein
VLLTNICLAHPPQEAWCGPTLERERIANARKSQVRSAVERVFACCQKRLMAVFAPTIGITRAKGPATAGAAKSGENSASASLSDGPTVRADLHQ